MESEVFASMIYIKITFRKGFENLDKINLDPKKLMYLFIYLCAHLVDVVQDVVLMQK